MPRAVLWTSLTNFTSLSPPHLHIRTKARQDKMKWKRSFPCALCKLIKQSQGDNNSLQSLPPFPSLHAVTPAGYLHAELTVPIQIVLCDFYRFLWLRVEFLIKTRPTTWIWISHCCRCLCCSCCCCHVNSASVLCACCCVLLARLQYVNIYSS